jgi:hypothetical protein
MPTDPRLGIPYPANTDANDVPRDIKAVVDKIGPLMAVDLQGSLSARPAAGVRGRYYNATDDSLFRDDGTLWVRLTPAPWKNFSSSPSRLQNGGGTTVTTTALVWTGTPVVRYRNLPRDRVEYEMSGLAALTGSQQFVGIEFTAPTAMGPLTYPGDGDCFNDSTRVVADSGLIAVYPTGGYLAAAYLAAMVNNNWTAAQAAANLGPTVRPGQWPVDDFGRSFRVHGYYSVS